MSRKTSETTGTDIVPIEENKPSRTRGLRRGDPNFGRVRRPPLPERVGAAAAEVFGEELGQLVYGVLEGMRRKTITASAGRLVLERLLPPGRPIRIDLPQVRRAQELEAAHERILAALNDGRVTPGEARELQAVVWESWCAFRAARKAEETEQKPRSPEEVRATVEAAARGYGMSYRSEKG